MNKKEFWVINISNRNVSLADLNLTIPPKAIVNLLDSRHYQFTEEQLTQSIKNGSLFKKKHFIYKRMGGPEKQISNISVSNECAPYKSRSAVEIKQQIFEELQQNDEDFAKESVELLDDK